MGEVPFKKALHIQFRERDHKLELDTEAWPSSVKGWTPDEGHMWRIVSDDQQETLPIKLWEAVLRFPSAPVHGIQRLHENQYNLPVSQNFHSFRVLAVEQRPADPPPRIYLFQNGLNEYDKQGLYYQIAAGILRNDPQAVCILRPFPGHLTRFPFQSFSEFPLDLYLSDGSILFRQFLRYMIESQWLLSVLVSRSHYSTPAGCMLLAADRGPGSSRLESDVVAGAIHAAWLKQYDFSAGEHPRRTRNQKGAPQLTAPPSEPSVASSVRALRAVLQWDEYEKHHAEVPTAVELPQISVVGYSLGGFVAQSLFMAWPFAISACATLLSGGPLRELSPTAFAHPEEWQTVLHSLRYELDTAMSEGLLRTEGDRRSGTAAVMGIDERLFLSLHRVFYEVFAQDYRGSYQTRLSEHGERMLFVLGGDDPIVRPRSVLDAAPSEGINMVEVARLRHFIGTPSHDMRETHQRKFWLPQVASLIGEFTSHASELHLDELKAGWMSELEFTPAGAVQPAEPRSPFDRAEGGPGTATYLTVAERLAIPTDGALDAALFTRCLDDLLLHATEEGSYLFIFRNAVPTLLLPDELVVAHGQALYHQDSAIRAYVNDMRVRRQLLEGCIRHTTLTLPRKTLNIFVNQDAEHGYPSQGETPLGTLPIRLDKQQHWKSVMLGVQHLLRRSPTSVRQFHADNARASGVLVEPPGDRGVLDELLSNAVDEVRAGRGEPLYVTALPDCWIFLSKQQFEGGTLNDAATGLYRLAIRREERGRGGLEEALLNGGIRIVAVSRARLNPRFRGRVVIDVRRAGALVMQAALCLAMSRTGFVDETEGDGEDAA